MSVAADSVLAMEWLTRIDELDAGAASDALAAVRDKVVAAEAEQFYLAAHWADLHAPEFVADHVADLAMLSAPGAEGFRPSGADGCPEIGEFAAAELAVLLGRSSAGGQQLIADAVNVRHRHPLLWAGIANGTVRVWLATKVARRCAAVGLTAGQALWVDSETTPYLSALPASRFLELVEAKIAAADPDGAATRAEQAALARYVRMGRVDEQGLAALVARARAGDVLHLVAVIDRIALILAQQGDPDPVDVRRASALRILANPAQALALLVDAARLDAAARDDAAPRVVPDQEGLLLTDSNGDLVLSEQLEAHLEPELSGQGEDTVAAGGLLDRDLLAGVVDTLSGFDGRRFDPLTVFHVHLSEADVAAGVGVARVEGIGPVLLSELRAWLGSPYAESAITLRPVLDPADVPPVDRYEIPDLMREAVIERDPWEIFPWGTLPARACDLDHRVPWRATGPPGRTVQANLGPLSRYHHRCKTTGGWRLRSPAPGVYWWRSPQGHWVVVDRTGARHHGRDPALDERLADRLEEPAA